LRFVSFMAWVPLAAVGRLAARFTAASRRRRFGALLRVSFG
jgi:hypothetical protein